LAEIIVKKNAFIYVSGRAKLMPASVEKAFSQIISDYFDSNIHEKEVFIA
jgi:sulfite reductase alpha subunit-like flavoprotein